MSHDSRQDGVIRNHEQRLAAIEYNLRRLMASMHVDWIDPPAGDAFPQPVLDALARGDKLTAIKLLREYTGLGLAEAKDMIERKG